MNNYLEKKFRLKDNNSDIRTEFTAGITTFMATAYILSVNPSILSEAGMNAGGVFTATILASIIATLIMGFYANYPFVLAPAMGLNAFFVYTVVMEMGYSWQFALTAVFIEGIIFVILSFFGAREAIFNSIPMNLKKAISVGVGLFIALLGFINSGIVVSGKEVLPDGSLTGLEIELGNLMSKPALLALIGLIIIGVLLAKKVKGALLIGMLLTSIIGIPMGLTIIPESLFQLPPSMKDVAFKFEWSQVFTLDMAIVVLTFLFVDVFDTVGTLAGVASKAKMLDENGELPRVERALLADSIGTITGSMLGTSTVTTYATSALGVADGGRTGLTAISAAFMFFLSLFIFPIFNMVPSAATAPALILVGLFMMSPIKEIDLDDYTEAIPAFLTIVMMPFSYSIAEGIVFGMVSYVLLKVFTGKYKEVSIVTYVLAVLFILKHAMPFITG